MRAMQDCGFEVLACGPRDEFAERIEAFGIRFLEVPISLAGTNPIGEFRTVRRLFEIYRKERPSAVHHFSLKPAIYGSLAARLAKVRFVFNTVTGLGVAFSRKGLLQEIVKGLWRLSCRSRSWTTFQNAEDLELFGRLNLIQPERTIVIRGSGVDTERFRCAGIPSRLSNGRSMTFLMFGRMLWAKGVREYIAAAEKVQKRLHAKGSAVDARFVLVGGAPAGNPTGVKEEWLVNPGTIPGDWLEQQAALGTIEYYPHDDNVVAYIEKADVVVLPSYYREGVPRSLLEAMSCGRAIITTDMPGCRDVVEVGVNGLLVKPRDAESLAAAFEYMVDHPQEVDEMGQQSRRLVLERFSDEIVARQTVDLYARAGLPVRDRTRIASSEGRAEVPRVDNANLEVVR
jgi:glycosyltransferase involved in cell wall biosynthesis